MEVMIGAVLLATVFGGLLATLVISRRMIQRSSVRLAAANRARSYLSELQVYVDAETWDDAANFLTVGTWALAGADTCTVTEMGGVRVAEVTVEYTPPE